MELLLFFGKTSPGRMAFIVLLSVVVGITGGLIIPLAIQAVIVLTAGRPTWLALMWLPIVVIAFIASKRFSHLQAAALTEQALEDVLLRIADAVRRLDYPTFERLDRADIYARLVNTPEITTAVIKSIDVIQNLLIILTCWVYLLLRSLSAGAVFISAGFLIFLALQLFDALSSPLVHEEAETERKLFQVVNHLLYGFKELKLDHAKNIDLFDHYLLPLLERIKTLHCRILLYVSERGLLMSICIFLVAGCTVFFFAPYDRSGEFLETLIIILYITTPANIMYDAFPYLGSGKEALKGLVKLLAQFPPSDPEPSAAGVSAAPAARAAVHEVQLENVLFTYPSPAGETGFTVGPLALSFKGGEITFIAGGNGSGKTTLLYLLTGLYQPSSGMIRLNGQPVNIANHHNLFAPVFADVHLFDQIYGLEQLDERRIAEVLARLELTAVLAVHERRFSTLNLSSGQQKRLALAVALWDDKPIYVFDEWAANQDPHFRRYFYEELLPDLKAHGKTVIAITHDDAYYHIADHLIKLEYGRVAREDYAPHPLQVSPSPAAAPTPPSFTSAVAARPRPAAQAPAGNLPEDAATFEISETLLKQLQRFFADTPKHLWRVALSLLGLANLCEVSIVFLLYQVRDNIFSARGQWLFTMFMLTVVLYITVYRRFDRLVSAFIEDRIALLRRRFAEQVRRLNLLAFQELSVEAIYAMLTFDIKAVAATSYSVIIVCYAISTTIITLFYLLFMSPAAALLVVVVLGGIGMLYVQSLFRMRQIIDELRAQERCVLAAINHLLDGFKELRLNRQKNEDFFHNGIQAQVIRLRQVKTRTNRFFIHNQTLAYVVWETLVVLIVIGLPLLTSASTSADQLLRIVGLVLFLPFSPLLETVPQLSIASLSVGRVLAMGATIESSAPEPLPESLPQPAAIQELAYRQLTFAYRAAGQRPFKVGPIDLTLAPGEIVFLTGGNGSGKSTLAKALMGLYPVQAGTVRLDRREIPLTAVRQVFGAVFSDYHLFDRLYGLADVDPAQVQQWLRVMELDHKVQFVDQQFSTLELSTGQRKRLALVAVLAENKPIYLFDEWAADQDPHFRAYFYQTLLPTLKAQQKTIVAITHDERYFHIADRVLKMDDGKLVARQATGGA